MEFLDRGEGCVPDPHSEYLLESEGLFVIIKNTTFKYGHKLASGDVWREAGSLANGYAKDKVNIMSTFNLLETDLNVHVGRDLLPISPNDDPSVQMFDVFIRDKIISIKEEPSFVFVVLMSHGFENEEFLLCDERDIQCCASESKHALKGQCHARSVNAHLVAPIQARFPGIPKIFLIQACRGGKMDDYLAKSGPSPADPFKYGPIPRSADTAIFYPVATEQLSFVLSTGTLFIQGFCEAVENLKKRVKTSENPNIREHAVYGWFDDICRETRSIVAHQKGVQNKQAGTKTFFQPVLATTLNKRLSFIRLLQTQVRDEGISSECNSTQTWSALRPVSFQREIKN